MIEGSAPPGLQLALSACQYPGGVLDRTPRQDLDLYIDRPGPADRSGRRLRDWLLQQPGRRALIHTGDSIYIDATAGLFDPQLVADGSAATEPGRGDALRDALRRAYRHTRGSLYRSVTQRLQLIDDHELIDNWEPSLDVARQQALQQRLDIGREVFIERALLLAAPPAPIGDSALPLWGEQPIGDLRCFIADTRTERSARDPAAPALARIMSRAQFGALLAWLDPLPQESGSTAYRRVVITPSILLPRRLASSEHPAGALRSDAWDGYPGALHALLAALAERPRLKGLFLSGDEHLPCVLRAEVARADGSAAPAELLSVHTGALYAPYPFANSRPEDFSDERSFGFRAEHAGAVRDYVCRIRSCWFPLEQGDGFTTLAFGADRCADPEVVFRAADGRDYVWPGG